MPAKSFTISGQLIDIHQQGTYPAEIKVEHGRIAAITELTTAPQHYILPGFIDAHIHIESSMLVPTAFAQLAVAHGTIGTVSDPHEIANVCGVAGVEYMIEDARKSPFKFFFGAPSCVPATSFETAGATIDASAIGQLMASPDIWYLAEMMNYPGVLAKDQEVMDKISAALQNDKPIDGHAPGLKGADAAAYASSGITTDHECTTLEEALDKIAAGMNILIREGSAAKNFDALHTLISSHPSQVMFCSDDKHPDELIIGHINILVKRALEKGYNLYDVLRAASLNPVTHYGLPVGLLRVGDPADFIEIDNLENFSVLRAFIDGILVAEKGKTLLPFKPPTEINNFCASRRKPVDFRVYQNNPGRNIRVIKVVDGQLVTRSCDEQPLIVEGIIEADPKRDLLKIVVINRYVSDAVPAIAFIKGFGLLKGAIASTVAHDCHNIIAVGVDDQSICTAVNAVIDAKGGIAVTNNSGNCTCLKLPVAGLMTVLDGYDTGIQYAALDKAAKQLGSKLAAPFMSLSFMALLVIPTLKISDLGLFDGTNFEFISLQQ